MTLSSNLLAARGQISGFHVGDWERLADSVRSWKPDVVVLIARKMPRLAEVLALSFGDALVISDLALPFSRTFLSGRRVAIVDDVVNVGSTLTRAQSIVDTLGAVETGLFALNRRADASDQVEAFYTQSVPLSRSGLDNFAHQVPVSISLLSKPYDLDFPSIRCVLRSPYSGFEDLLAELQATFGENRVVDASTGLAAESGLHRVVVDWPGSDGLRKLRMYVDAVSGECNVVPMLIPPVIESSVDPSASRSGDLGAVLLPALEGVDGAHEAAARLALFADSLDFGHHAIGHLDSVLARSSDEYFSLNDAEVVFGPLVRRAQRSFITPSTSSCESCEVCSEVVDRPSTSPALDALVTPDFVEAVSRRRAASDPKSSFVALFDELASRAGASCVSDYSLDWPHSREVIVDQPYLRLRVGFTFGDLVQAMDRLCAFDSIHDARRAVGKLLDHFVDAGVVVPTLGTYGGAVHRIYRKGEAKYRDDAVERILLGVRQYGQPLSRTRISKLAAIMSFSEAPEALSSVGPAERGNVVLLDGDVVDGDAEITQYMLRTGALLRSGKKVVD